MTKLSPHLFISNGALKGINPEALQRAVNFRSVIAASGAFPVLTLRDLSYQTNVPYLYLRGLVDRKFDGYSSITRVKKDGSQRRIASPQPKLMHVQRWLLHNVLVASKHHDASFAYREGRSIVDCAWHHAGSNWLVKLDLHDFFGTIREPRVYRTFAELGMPSLLSFELARICTRSNQRVPVPSGIGSGQTKNNFVYSEAVPGHLPQGAPTSGALANTAAFGLDVMLRAIAKDMSFEYSRYSDDLTFSSSMPFSRQNATKLIAAATHAITLAGFTVHNHKTRIIPPGARKVVLGLLVDDAVHLLPEFRRQLSNHIRGVDKFGLVEHARHRGFRSALSLVNFVDGSIAFAHDVDEKWAVRCRNSWFAALNRDGFLT